MIQINNKYNLDDCVEISVLTDSVIEAKIVSVISKQTKKGVVIKYELEPIKEVLQEYGNYEQPEEHILRKI